jgi:hypothetical protein
MARETSNGLTGFINDTSSFQVTRFLLGFLFRRIFDTTTFSCYSFPGLRNENILLEIMAAGDQGMCVMKLEI